MPHIKKKKLARVCAQASEKVTECGNWLASKNLNSTPRRLSAIETKGFRFFRRYRVDANLLVQVLA
jgi:hypothetical protein